jgi:hypothetical protein
MWIKIGTEIHQDLNYAFLAFKLYFFNYKKPSPRMENCNNVELNKNYPRGGIHQLKTLHSGSPSLLSCNVIIIILKDKSRV